MSEKLDVNQREVTSSVSARDQWDTEKTELLTQLAEVSICLSTLCLKKSSHAICLIFSISAEYLQKI